MKSIYSTYIAVAALVLIGSTSCKRAGGEYPGTEYMPDMVHSVAYEANYYTYYSNNTWGTEAEYRQFHEPGLPVKGTIPRGTSVYNDAENLSFRIEEHTLSMQPLYNPYHYSDSEDERLRAQKDIVENPLKPASEAQLKAVLGRGKNLYNVYCGVCHGEAGDGNGVLYNGGDGPYKARPADYTSDAFLQQGNTDGRFYHAIMYGKNAMLGHADKLNYEERWMVIHYIRSLQHKAKGSVYDLAAAIGKTAVAADTTAITQPK